MDNGNSGNERKYSRKAKSATVGRANRVAKLVQRKALALKAPPQKWAVWFSHPTLHSDRQTETVRRPNRWSISDAIYSRNSKNDSVPALSEA